MATMTKPEIEPIDLLVIRLLLEEASNDQRRAPRLRLRYRKLLRKVQTIIDHTSFVVPK